MAQTIQLRRTLTLNNPPDSLAHGELAFGLNDNPIRGWIGTPSGIKELQLGGGPFLPLAGGTLFGDLTIASPTASSVFTLNKSSAIWSPQIRGSFNFNPRWAITLGAGAESGGNIGSDFAITRYSDAGVGLGDPLSITRATGAVSMPLMDSDLRINKSMPTLTLDKTASAQSASLTGTLNGVNRWAIRLGGAQAETGSNAGSDFDIARYNDAGSYLNSPLHIDRATGLAIVLGDPTVGLGIATKQYVDAQVGVGVYLPLAGGTMTGAINFAAGQTIDGYLPLTGGTLTGDLTISKTSPILDMRKAASGEQNVIFGRMGALNRWAMILGNVAAEAGGNAGSDLTIWRYADNGSALDSPFAIARATGAVSMPLMNSNLTITKSIPLLTLNKQASGQNNLILGQMNGLARWYILVGNATAESGANAGSDFAIQRHADDGSTIGTALTITRATGLVTVAADPTAALGVATKQYVDAQTTGAYLPLTGGTLTGNLTITKTGPLIVINKPASGDRACLDGRTNNVQRWRIELGNATAEGGANAGSDFGITSYNDAGTWLSTPLTIRRSDGAVSMPLMNSDLTITKATQPIITLNPTAAGVAASIRGHVNGVLRWSMAIPNTATESGSNAGSDFAIQRFSDTGTSLGIPFSITRSTGLITVSGDPTAALGIATKQYVDAVTTSLGNYLPLAGGTLTGHLDGTSATLTDRFTVAGGSPQIFLQKSASGQQNLIWGRTGTSPRWLMRFGNTTAEGGADSGSDFDIIRYNDAGTNVGTPFTIRRSDGAVNMPLMYSDLTITKATQPMIILNPTTAVGASVRGRVNGVERWMLSLGNGAAETGSNAGSDFDLFRYSDAGVNLGTVLKIWRASGLATVAADPTAALGIATKQYVDAVSTSIGNYLPLTGGTLTGNLAITQASPRITFDRSVGTAGDTRLQFQANGVARWIIFYAADGATADTGGGFIIRRHNNAGTSLGDPFQISRETGAVSIPLMGSNFTVQTASPNIILEKSASGQQAYLLGRTGTSWRWLLRLGNTTTEASNGGSDFDLIRYNDASANVGTVLFFSRATGLGTVAADPTAPLGIATKQYVDAVSTNLGNYLPLIGGTLTGNVIMSSAGPTLDFRKAASTQQIVIFGRTGALSRWALLLGNTSPESGGNAGSNLSINRYADDGSYLDVPFMISRETGSVSIPLITTNTTIRGGSTAMMFDNTTAGANSTLLTFQQNASNRWRIGATTTAAAQGGAFYIQRMSDDGNNRGVAMNINRDTGQIDFTGAIVSAGTVTVTNNVTISGITTVTHVGTTANPTIQLNKTTATLRNLIIGQFNGASRWVVELGDGTAETGSNAGSNFAIGPRGDDGAILANALTITRSNGHVAIPNITGVTNFVSRIQSEQGYRTRPGTAGPFGGNTFNINWSNPGTGSQPDLWIDGTNIGRIAIGNLGSYLPLTGGTLTGGLTGTTAVFTSSAQVTGANPQYQLNKSASGGRNMIQGFTNGSSRWIIDVGDGTAETGSNTGSNFGIVSRNDDGTALATPLWINRASGIVSLRDTTINGWMTSSTTNSVTDWNDAILNGFYMSSAAANNPTNTAIWYIGYVIRHNNVYVTQTVWDFNNTRTVWRRWLHNGTWNAWVQQSGSNFSVALPTGMFLPLAGGTLTGALTVGSNAELRISKTAATAGNNQLAGYNVNQARWLIRLGDGAAETGANAGSNFSISARNDDGTALSTPLSITRSTGAVSMPLMNSNLNITKSAPTVTLNKTAATDTIIIWGNLNGLTRWGISPGDGTAETGGNAGSDFSIQRRSDAGTFLGTAFSINRATGITTCTLDDGVYT